MGVDALTKREPTETKLGSDNPLALDSIHRRAHELAPSKPSEAEPLFRQALEGYRKTQGPDGALTLDLTTDLAGLLDQTGRSAVAEPLFRDALKRARKQFAPGDPRTAGILAPFGLSLIQQGKWTEAETVLRESPGHSREDRSPTYGPPSTRAVCSAAACLARRNTTRPSR